MIRIFIDADACPMKQEVYRVAARYDLEVTVVANAWMRIPDQGKIALQLVEGGFDMADDWIVEHAGQDDIVITADIPLASLALKKGASVLGTTGNPFTEDNIGHVLATRNILSDLRESGVRTGGPPPIQPRDRSRFLQSLDTMVQLILRRRTQARP
jgi:uncharacterized protein YaiI (UPF0178 family)